MKNSFFNSAQWVQNCQSNVNMMCAIDIKAPKIIFIAFIIALSMTISKYSSHDRGAKGPDDHLEI